MDKQKENIQFRILYFIGIIMIVAGHIGGGGVSLFYEFFPAKSFHLALFIFCSGYFFANNINKKSSDVIIKKFKKMIIPLYIWNLIYGIIVFLLHKCGIKIGMGLSLKSLIILPIYNGHQFMFNLASWFIWPLFIIEIINIFIIKFTSKKSIYGYIYFVITLLLGFLGVQLAINGFNKTWWLLLVKILYFLPFFAFGILYRNNLEKYDILSNRKYFLIIISITLLSIYIFNGTIIYVPAWCNNFDSFYRPFIVGFLGILFWLRLSKIMIPVFKNSKLMYSVSKNTFSIMMHHLTGFFILNTFWFLTHKYLKLWPGFSFKKYSLDIYYSYLPKNLYQFKILYVIVGIAFSLFIVKIESNIYKKNKS